MRLFYCDLAFCDNRVIKIGSFIRVLSPHPTKKEMKGINILNTNKPVVVLRSPIELNNIRFIHIDGRNLYLSVLNNELI